MTTNMLRYGFRFHSTEYGSHEYTPRMVRVASGYQAAIGGVTDAALALRPGDPIHMLNTGLAQLAAAGETVDGIVCGIKQYWDGEKMVVGGYKLPYNTVYGTVYERESQILIIPVLGNLFEVDCDDAATATTYAGYRAFVGEACDHAFATTTATADGMAHPKLDISTHSAADGQWRIWDISHTQENVDFAGLNVKLIVKCHEPGTII